MSEDFQLGVVLGAAGAALVLGLVTAPVSCVHTRITEQSETHRVYSCGHRDVLQRWVPDEGWTAQGE